MRQPAAFLAVVLLSAAATQVAAVDGQTPAVRPAHVEKVFLVPSSEGYGVGECLIGGRSECGQIVADAWCEAQGFASAAAYGVAAKDEYTGTIDDAKAADRPIRITCQD